MYHVTFSLISTNGHMCHCVHGNWTDKILRYLEWELSSNVLQSHDHIQFQYNNLELVIDLLYDSIHGQLGSDEHGDALQESLSNSVDHNFSCELAVCRVDDDVKKLQALMWVGV